MPDTRIRQQIALLAARLMYEREEKEYFTAKRKAARQLGVDWRHRPGDLPSNAEIRDHVQRLAGFYEGERRNDDLRDMRFAALRVMRLLAAFRPRLIGSVLTGHVRKGSDIDLHVFTDTASAVTAVLDEQRLEYDLERKRVVKHNVARTFTHIHARDGRFEYELTLYAADQAHYVFKSSITGRAIERKSIAELEQFLAEQYPDAELDADANPDARAAEDEEARWARLAALLRALDGLKQNVAHHPEGEALYHSLQVFELARERVPWDEEFLLAALLHDVGKAIDPADHVAAGVASLAGLVTERTAFLIEHHMLAHAHRDGTLGHRARRRLEASEHFEDLMLLQELDAAGRRRGAVVGSVEEALAYVRALDEQDDGWDDDAEGRNASVRRSGPTR